VWPNSLRPCFDPFRFRTTIIIDTCTWHFVLGICLLQGISNSDQAQSLNLQFHVGTTKSRNETRSERITSSY
jgi:hypothetical protein